jgi:DsbC/DsbD-like thiol-disulfide interchange protein
MSVGDQKAEVRLLATPGLTDGHYEAGVEIAMGEGSHTYWKMPGDSGVPPVFAFNGSDNVAAATVSFPAPTRISEQGIEAFGYETQVVFPVAVTPRDAAKPVTLHVDVTFAVCNKICIPGHASATLTLDPKGSGTEGESVRSAVSAVPMAISAAERTKLEITPIPGTEKSSWTLSWHGATPITDIFPDAPEGFILDTRRRGPDSWTLTAAQSVGAKATVKVPVSLVLKRPAGSLIVTETLDVTPAIP